MKRHRSPADLFMNLSIRAKILSCMLIVSLLAVLVSYSAFSFVSYHEQTRQQANAARIKVEGASISVNDVLNVLFKNIISFVETPAITALFENAQKGVLPTANTLSNSLDQLISLANSNTLIDAVLLITPTGAYISSRNIRLLPEHQNLSIWPDYGGELINWLSVRQTPFASQDKEIVPLCLSFGYVKGFQTYIPHLTPKDEPCVFRMFIFFDYKKLFAFLQSEEDDMLSVTYFAGEDMMPISLTEHSPFYKATTSQELRSEVAHLNGYSEICVDGQSYLVYVGNSILTGLRMINITSKERLLLAHTKIANIILFVAIITAAATVVFSTAVTRQLTRPLLKLVQSVRSIDSGDTSKPFFVTHYKDEIGELGTAIAQMLNTIQTQMRTIREEERRYSNAEIRILTQQINPHFIYNTLDCIRWEILRGNVEGSSSMVESLATFLRLGFGHGSETVSVSEEILRIEQYLNIMRQRLDGSIFFFNYVDAQLCEWQIPKLILQPLVENSILHGFSPGVFKTDKQGREIYIRCNLLPDGCVSLAVEDNGAGIDIKRAQASINLDEEDPSPGHIGLRNSYLRMRAYFGAENVRMQFSSTPFFLNSVEYIITPNHDTKTKEAV